MTEQEIRKKEFREEINVRDLLHTYVSHWRWFAAAILIAFTATWFMLRYTPKSYESKAKLLIKFDKGGAYSELYAFQDLGLFEGSVDYNNLHNEKEILHSRPLIERVVRKLDLNIQYFLVGSRTGIERKEYYKTSPVQIRLIDGDPAEVKTASKFDIEIISAKKFYFIDNEQLGSKPYNFGDTIQSEIGRFVLDATRFYTGKNGAQRISIYIRPIEATVTGFQGRLKVEPISDQVDILQLSIRGPNVLKNNDFLDSLVVEHTRQTIDDQMKIYRNTTDFINDRISAIADELSEVEKEGEEYKTQYDFSDVLLSEKSLYDRTLVNEKNLVDAEIQLELIKFLYDFLVKLEDPETLLPANLGLEDYGINHAVEDYNRIALERIKLLENSSPKNPGVIKLENELKSIRASLKTSLGNSRSSLQLEVNRLRSLESSINEDISSLPKHKRVLRSIDRQQQVKESLYLYLLQKREENEIASAVVEGNSKIIESAYSNGAVVSPNKKVYYAVALFFGLFIPFSLIYIRGLLNNKVNSREDLDEHNMPHFGNIPWAGKQKMVVSSGSNSPEAEAFRILRTNTSFVLNRKAENGQVLMVTSTVAQEGKSFIAMNLAASYALTGKKTLVVGLDLRAPKLTEYANIKAGKGVTDFVLDDRLKLNELIIRDTALEHLYYLPSGIIPPNPSEILMRDEIAELIASLRTQFDMIVLDTAPVGLVTDTLLISHLADACIYVVRAHFLEKKQLALPANLIREGKLQHVGIVINAVTKNTKTGYGYGYGYGYGSTEPARKSFLKRLRGS